MALILTATTMEKIFIGEDIVVTLVGINGRQARLAFEAPKNIEIDREKIRIKKEESRKK